MFSFILTFYPSIYPCLWETAVNISMYELSESTPDIVASSFVAVMASSCLFLSPTLVIGLSAD